MKRYFLMILLLAGCSSSSWTRVTQNNPPEDNNQPGCYEDVANYQPGILDRPLCIHDYDDPGPCAWDTFPVFAINTGLHVDSGQHVEPVNRFPFLGRSKVFTIKAIEPRPGNRLFRIGDRITHIAGRALYQKDDLRMYINLGRWNPDLACDVWVLREVAGHTLHLKLLFVFESCG